jgi:hypothetical protein
MRTKASQQNAHRGTIGTVKSAGFTLAEVSVAFGIATLMIGGFLGFLVTSARLTKGTAKQSAMNQQLGNGVEIMLQRIRLANSLAIDAQNETLTMTFDDDPTVDNDGDGVTYNDADHSESFQFRYATTTNSPDQGINFVDWINGVGNTATKRQLFANVRKLPNLKVFVLTNANATVFIDFGLLDPYGKDLTQNIEIKTQATRRNRR